MSDIDLIIFDCDGVLIDSEGLSARVLIRVLADLGVDVDMDYFCANFVGRSFPTVARDIRENWHVALPEGFEQSYRDELLEVFERELQPTPGLIGMLDSLQTPCCSTDARLALYRRGASEGADFEASPHCDDL